MKISKTRSRFQQLPLKNSIHIKVQDGLFSVQGLDKWYSNWQEPYHLMLTLPWVGFIAIVSLLYIALNIGFAGLYLLGGDCIVNGNGSFQDAFFFSVQTLAGIGYGVLSPKTTYANYIVVIEAITGLFAIALLTGLSFARFSRPTAKVMFSKFAIVMPQNNLPTLMLRTANQRRNQILEAQVRLSLSRDEVTTDGHHLRRFYELQVLRSHNPAFSLPWTLMHPINEQSPLYGFSAESLAESQSQIIVSLSGIDETVYQNVHARHTYGVNSIILNHQLVDIIHIVDERNRYVDLASFHHVMPL
ncbi:ion channel [Chamaesiphon sp. VAR_69_metabat_338]|uniref:ion channel n=1 Tax=Chamaesiphon sp. VAR_69_metabat_338 TaxID=2964704 RepID=UPI00286DC18F|nr:ion channel [Chamaesiphon sp. VAR_69_metabat_338]